MVWLKKMSHTWWPHDNFPSNLQLEVLVKLVEEWMMNHSFSQKEVNPPTQRIGHSWVVKKKKGNGDCNRKRGKSRNRCRVIKGGMDWIIQSQSLALCKMVASIKEKAYKHNKEIKKW